MKKYLLFLFLFAALLGGGTSVHAATCITGSDGMCPSGQICDPDTKFCISSTDPKYSAGTMGIGGTCSSKTDCRGSSTTCNITAHICVYGTGDGTSASAGSPASSGSSAAATPGSTASPGTCAAGQTCGNANFIPLTQLPGLKDISSSPNITAFLNILYKLCIGAAATIAVLQIMRAGLMWMAAGDNSENISKAKGLISASIFGLILVLSPYIVFSIINPAVLNISFNFGGLNGAGTAANGSGAAAATPPSPSNPPASLIQSTQQPNPACKAMPNGTQINTDGGSQQNQDEQCCANQSRTGGIQCSVGPDHTDAFSGKMFCYCGT